MTGETREEEAMPMFFFSVRETSDSEMELIEVDAPDLMDALQTLAGWCPEIHIVRLEGVSAGSPGYA
ncbi:MAG: hypothetical protein ACE10F_07775 [Candidatus Methylomirabilales bacterium]|nr:hypothetical protein [candidate division NC10 bacterium]